MGPASNLWPRPRSRRAPVLLVDKTCGGCSRGARSSFLQPYSLLVHVSEWLRKGGRQGGADLLLHHVGTRERRGCQQQLRPVAPEQVFT